MKNSYANMRYILPAYFNQDFSLDYDSPYSVISKIIGDNRGNPRLGKFRSEIISMIANEDVLDEGFFYELGLDTAPFESTNENREFFQHFVEEIDTLL